MAEEIVAFIFGVLVKIFYDVVKERLSSAITSIVINKASKRYKVVRIPDPPADFRCFRIGNIELPAMSLIGTPESTFGPSDVEVAFAPIIHFQQEHYPKDLLGPKQYLLARALDRYGINSSKLRDNTIVPRLEKISQGPEIEGDKRGHLLINLALTSFDTFLTTNKSLDYSVIPHNGWISQFNSNVSIRDAYCEPPYDNFSKSTLANLPAVHVAVISRNIDQQPKDQLIIRKRSTDVMSYKGFYQVSATGYLSLDHRDLKGVPSIFRTALAEAKQEIADSLSLSSEDYKLFGLAIRWEDMLPVFYGYVETGKSVNELLGDFRRDDYEGKLYALSFEPKTVLNHIIKEKWEPVSALAAIATLLAFNPKDQVAEIAKRLPAKPLRDYYESQKL